MPATRRSDGFTLIELLIVCLIIGVLAAIAIPTFIGQRRSADDAAARSDLQNDRIAINSYSSKFDGRVTTDVAVLRPFGFVNSSGVTLDPILPGVKPGDFCLMGTSASSTRYVVTESFGVTEGTC